jgi:hypothetical protein
MSQMHYFYQLRARYLRIPFAPVRYPCIGPATSAIYREAESFHSRKTQKA